VFCTLDDNQVNELALDKSCNIYKKGQLIFYEGNRPTGLYCVNQGKIKIFQTGEEGKEQILRLAKEGDILGYRALISGEPYSGSGAVMEDAVVCYIPRKTFFELLQKNSELSTRMMQLLSHDLKEAEARITGLAQKPVRERMAETILMLREFYGTDDDEIIQASVSREDIAGIVGTSTETCIRVIADFKHEKLIELAGKRIKISDLNGLIKAAHVFD
jgi:CRP/FNR family transcriptional regulator